MPSSIFIRNNSASAVPMPGHLSSSDCLHNFGVPELPPCTAPFDPGYDPSTVEGHLDQSANLMENLKISMSCSIIADESTTRRKVAAAAIHAVPIVTGKGLFQIAVAQGQLESYLDLCADFGVARVECGESLVELRTRPSEIVKMAHSRGLEIQVELGARPGCPETVQHLLDQGDRWLNAGAVQLAAESREVELGTAFFDRLGRFDPAFPDRLARAFGLSRITFAAPDARTQFAVLDHFGREVHLCNVRLEDLLNVESFRRGLHSAAFSSAHLHPDPAKPDDPADR